MTISFARHQFPPAIIRHAVRLYVRFTLSYRDVEDLLAERGLDESYETVRRWVLKFGPLFARELRRRRPRPTSRWHLDEMAVMIAGRQFWLWRAGDDEGEVLDLLVQRRRDKAAAVKLMRLQPSIANSSLTCTNRDVWRPHLTMTASTNWTKRFTV
jgi:putative transposase